MRTNLKLALALLCGVGLGIGATQGLQAQQEIKRNVLQHADLTGTTTTEVYMTMIEAPPGSAFAPHIPITATSSPMSWRARSTSTSPGKGPSR